MTTTSSIPSSKHEDFSMKMSTQHLRIAVIGNVDAGKSTLIGTLKSGLLDDGRGQARILVMKHQHEIDSGRTSTITTHTIGYKEDGTPVQSVSTLRHSNTSNVSKIQLRNDNEIAAESHTVVSLVDLAGHEKYLKTTISGISSKMVDYALVLVNASHGPNHMTRHHISLAVSFGIPIVILLTKIDNCPQHALKTSKEEIANIIRSSVVQKRPYLIKSASDVKIVEDKMHALVPILAISSVTGEGIDLVHALLGALPKRRRHSGKIGRNLEILVDDTFNITGVGTIISGFVNAGKVRVGDIVFLGPLNNGSYIKTTIKSAQISGINVSTIVSGNVVGLALTLSKDQRKMLRKGMVVLDTPSPGTTLFEAEMMMIKGAGVDGTTIKTGYETMAHILHLKQHVRVEKIELLDATNAVDDVAVVRPGSRAKITFRFLKRQEFIRKGMRILFRDGHIRGVGMITATMEENDD